MSTSTTFFETKLVIWVAEKNAENVYREEEEEEEENLFAVINVTSIMG